jgi:hypothetical protein
MLCLSGEEPKYLLLEEFTTCICDLLTNEDANSTVKQWRETVQMRTDLPLFLLDFCLTMGHDQFVRMFTQFKDNIWLEIAGDEAAATTLSTYNAPCRQRVAGHCFFGICGRHRSMLARVGEFAPLMLSVDAFDEASALSEKSDMAVINAYLCNLVSVTPDNAKDNPLVVKQLQAALTKDIVPVFRMFKRVCAGPPLVSVVDKIAIGLESKEREMVVAGRMCQFLPTNDERVFGMIYALASRVDFRMQQALTQLVKKAIALHPDKTNAQAFHAVYELLWCDGNDDYVPLECQAMMQTDHGRVVVLEKKQCASERAGAGLCALTMTATTSQGTLLPLYPTLTRMFLTGDLRSVRWCMVIMAFLYTRNRGVAMKASYDVTQNSLDSKYLHKFVAAALVPKLLLPDAAVPELAFYQDEQVIARLSEAFMRAVLFNDAAKTEEAAVISKYMHMAKKGDRAGFLALINDGKPRTVPRHVFFDGDPDDFAWLSVHASPPPTGSPETMQTPTETAVELFFAMFELRLVRGLSVNASIALYTNMTRNPARQPIFLCAKTGRVWLHDQVFSMCTHNITPPQPSDSDLVDRVLACYDPIESELLKECARLIK